MTRYACIETVPFEIDHIRQMGIELPAWQLEMVTIDRCRGWTMMADGAPFLAAGILLMWPGVAEGWQFNKPKWRRYLKSVVREFRRRLPQLWEEAGLRRLQASCIKSPEYWTWLQYHGLNNLEGCMKNYGFNGEDHILAAKVK